ncbi:MAG: cytidylyltransferase domain-containing protein [Candidatus Limnocylindria bacterium]
MSRTVAIVQARVGSERFPGKVMEPIRGVPMLLRQLERVARATTLDDIVVATTTATADDDVTAIAQDAGYDVVRGSEEDVLDRFRVAARSARADIVVRLTGDCPLIDPGVVDEAVEAWRDGQPNVDFVSNAISETYPDGMDTEVFSRRLLERAWDEAQLPSEREHVTFFFWRTGLFRVRSVVAAKPLGHLRFTVDYPADLEWVRRVYDALYPENPSFSLDDIVAALPALGEPPNAGIDRNVGWQPALEQDELSRPGPGGPVPSGGK